MRISQKTIQDIGILSVEGELDAEHSSQFKRALEKVRKAGGVHIILDLHKVSFIDSTGLGAFISLMRKLSEEGGRLRLTGLQDEVRSIFEITRLFRVFDISKDVEQALIDIKQSQ